MIPLLDAESIVRRAGLKEGTTFVDNSLRDGATWMKAFFFVPLDVSDERVQFKADGFKKQFGEYLERQDPPFTVLSMSDPILVTNPIVGPGGGRLDPTRKKYGIQALVTRRPVEHHMDVSDSLVEPLLKLGMRLTE